MTTDFFKTDFWKFNIGHVAGAVVLLIGGYVGFKTQSATFETKFDAFMQSTNEWRNQIDTKIKEMDENGTKASSKKTDMEQQTLSWHEARLTSAEGTLRNMGSINTKVDRLIDDVHGLLIEQRQHYQAPNLPTPTP